MNYTKRRTVKTAPIGVTIPIPLERELQRRADEEGANKSEEVTEALRKHFGFSELELIAQEPVERAS
jgi:hypothetical protein